MFSRDFVKQCMFIAVLVLVFTPVLFAGGEAEEVRAVEAEVVIDMIIQPHEMFRPGPDVFKNYVEGASGGRMRVQFHNLATIGNPHDALEAVEIGEYHMGSTGTDGAIGARVPEVQVLNMPFLFPNAQVGANLLQRSYADVLHEKLREGIPDVRVVGITKNSFRHSFFSKPIRTPGDIRGMGLVMRTMVDPLHVAVWEAFGASVVTVPGPERYEAMSSGLMEGLEGGIASVAAAGIMEVADYIVLTGHQLGFLYWIANERWLSSLPEDLREIVIDGAMRGTWAHWGALTVDSARTLERLVDEGNHVLVLTDSELAQWREIAVPVARQFVERSVDPEFIEFTLNAIQEVIDDLGGRRASVLH